MAQVKPNSRLTRQNNTNSKKAKLKAFVNPISQTQGSGLRLSQTQGSQDKITLNQKKSQTQGLLN